MNCHRPYIHSTGVAGCGQCTPCRIIKRRVWTHRITLETALRADNTFVTLTYDDEHLPQDQSVSPRELQLFLKRLRKQSPKIRYFGVGEYGDTTFRPHYHLALFGYPNCSRHRTYINRQGSPCCQACETVRQAWGKGQIQLANLDAGSAAYIAGYVVKKMTKQDDPRLEGRLPEFSRMSLKPGIGHDMMHEVASTLLQHNLDEKLTDVPNALQHGKKVLPLGRYLTRTLRHLTGKPKNAPQATLQKQAQEMQTMRVLAWDNQKPLSQIVHEKTLGKRIQIEARQQRQRKRTYI